MPIEIQLFWNNLEGTKPPYECPICHKIYRSLQGIRGHLNDHQTKEISPERQHIPLNFENYDDKIDIEINGKITRIGINEPIVFDKVTIESCSNSKDHKFEKKRNIEIGASSPTLNKLPEIQFKIFDDYVEPLIRKISKNTYFRYIEPSQEELEEEIQYDLDDEDNFWLEELNKKRKQNALSTIHIDTLEWIMDKFEKKWHFKKIYRYPKLENGERSLLTRDEDALCCICLDGECHQNNTILFCDLCNLAVHQECYGVPHIPEGPWICRRCLLSPSKLVNCCLCPSQSGAFKQTDDGRWAHVICALFVPDVGFANPVFLEPIDGIERVAPARWKLTCQVCRKRRSGACIQCHRPTCYSAFHATCAQLAGFHLKLEPVVQNSLSDFNQPEGIRYPGLWSGATAPRRTAYCEMHTGLMSDDEHLPQEKPEKKKLNDLNILNGNLGQILSIPYISEDNLKEIRNTIPGFKNKNSENDKDTFIQRALAYWKLKRKSRNGVPLTNTPPSRYVKKFKTQINEIMSKELKSCKRLRRDLEKVRLLNELIKKREKYKTEMISLTEEITFIKLDHSSTMTKYIQDRNFENLIKDDMHKKNLSDESKPIVNEQFNTSTSSHHSPLKISKKSLMQQFLKEKHFDIKSPEASNKLSDTDENKTLKTSDTVSHLSEIAIKGNNEFEQNKKKKSLRSNLIENDNQKLNCKDDFPHDVNKQSTPNINTKNNFELNLRKRSYRSIFEIDEFPANNISTISSPTRKDETTINMKDEDIDDFIPLSTSDLVWAKCFGFPWYPAIIINPKVDSIKCHHQDANVYLPTPSEEVLTSSKPNHFLVCFFDAKRTWQWLPRKRLDPLGVDSGLDSARLKAGPKAGGSADRKSVMQAYERAIKHRCEVTGDDFATSMSVILSR